MNKKSLAAIGAIISIGALPGFAHAQNVQEEVDKQISKAIGDAINARVTAQVVTAASAPNNLWGSVGGMKIDSTSPGAAFDLTIPTILIGYDRDIRGKYMVGVSGSYFSTSGNLGIANFDLKGYSVSPYFAYLFDKNFFGTVKLNVGYTNSSVTSSVTAGGFNTHTESDSDALNYGLGVSLNGLYRPGNFLMKGRVGADYSGSSNYTTTSIETRNSSGTLVFYSYNSGTVSSSSTSYGLEGELGYFFASRSYGFAGVQLSGKSKDVFASAGFEQGFGKASAISLKYGKKIAGDEPANTKVNVQSLFLTARFGF